MRHRNGPRRLGGSGRRGHEAGEGGGHCQSLELNAKRSNLVPYRIQEPRAISPPLLHELPATGGSVPVLLLPTSLTLWCPLRRIVARLCRRLLSRPWLALFLLGCLLCQPCSLLRWHLRTVVAVALPRRGGMIPSAWECGCPAWAGFLAMLPERFLFWSSHLRLQPAVACSHHGRVGGAEQPRPLLVGANSRG